MALIDFTGFDNAVPNARPEFFDTGSDDNNVDPSSDTRYGNGYSIYYSSSGMSGRKYTTITTPGAATILGFAFKGSGSQNLNVHFSYPGAPITSYRLAFVIRTNGSITVEQNGATLGSTATGFFDTTEWNYFELKGVIHPTSGMFAARLNGILILFEENKDTYVIGDGDYYCDFIEFYSMWGVMLDDIYLCDDSGAACNDFLGEVIVDAIKPSANGNQNDGVASAGSNYECVDEQQYNDDTDYVTLDAVNEIELYALEDLPVTGYTKTIYGVRIVQRSKKTDAETKTVEILLRTNSTNYLSAEQIILSTSYASAHFTWQNNPADSQSWEEADINALEAGLKVTT